VGTLTFGATTANSATISCVRGSIVAGRHLRVHRLTGQQSMQ
jgi:hypothetical protein